MAMISSRCCAILASLGVALLLLMVTSVKSSKDNLFKINKLNLVWNKAQHSLGSTKLKDLKSDLAKHELDEINLKKMKAHNQDKEGLHEAAIRRRLLTILTKYNLERYYDDVHTPGEQESSLSSSTSKENSAKSGDSPKLNAFRDKKLDKLWKKAEKAGFSPEELMILHEEFQHQQDKLDEHYRTMSNIDDKLEKITKDSWENSIESSLEDEIRWTKPKESPSDKKKRLDENIHQDLKKQYIEIKNGIHQLHHKVVSGKITPGDDGFEETSTKQLWDAALDSNFTLDELDSLKEELRHYEVRIKKLKHFENQLERNHVSSKDRQNEDDDDELKHIKRKVKELKFKVAKTHETIEQKISTPKLNHYREDL